MIRSVLSNREMNTIMIGHSYRSFLMQVISPRTLSLSLFIFFIIVINDLTDDISYQLCMYDNNTTIYYNLDNKSVQLLNVKFTVDVKCDLKSDVNRGK